MSVAEVLFLPGGGGDGAEGVHDDLCTADDHSDQQHAEEGDAGQSQSQVHVHEGWLRRALDLHGAYARPRLSSDRPAQSASILERCLQMQRGRKRS